MACTINTGRSVPCKSAFGGIKRVYMADWGTITALTIDSTSKEVTAFTGSPTWFQFDVKSASSLETTVTSSRDNGTTFYTQTLTLVMPFLDAKTQAILQVIAVGRTYLVIEDYYGNSFLCGYQSGCELTSGAISTGVAAADLSGFSITMEAMDDRAPYFLTTAVTSSGDQIDPTLAAPPVPGS